MLGFESTDARSVPAFEGQKFILLLEKDLKISEFVSVKNSYKVSKIAFPHPIRTPSRFLEKILGPELEGGLGMFWKVTFGPT